jgi:hypothetical protein
MRLSLITALGIAAFLGIVAVDTPNANAVARSTTIAGGASRTAFAARRTHRVAVMRRGLRGARGAVACRTTIVNGVRVRRCAGIRW